MSDLETGGEKSVLGRGGGRPLLPEGRSLSLEIYKEFASLQRVLS